MEGGRKGGREGDAIMRSIFFEIQMPAGNGEWELKAQIRFSRAVNDTPCKCHLTNLLRIKESSSYWMLDRRGQTYGGKNWLLLKVRGPLKRVQQSQDVSTNHHHHHRQHGNCSFRMFK